MNPATLVAVCASASHTFSKPARDRVRLIEDFGIEGDVHAGGTVQHVSRVAKDAAQPNLRQVHLIHAELHDELRAEGFEIAPGAMGENFTTRGIDLLALPRGTRLHLGDSAVVEVTGLRNPCAQLDGLAPGLLSACVGRDAAGRTYPKSGVMAVVRVGGEVRAGDAIRVELPSGPHEALQKV